ncbi:hypothetical protein A9Q81_21135 [Gammaproteobacteria bacterium 42_54_T18]|nr:hypothetical protein A9Q81_21135 [Gammaproteobacteria bacterium 42_54_T18]
MKIKHPISVLTLTLTPFFIATGCSSTGGQHPTSVAKTPTIQHINTVNESVIDETQVIANMATEATADVTTVATVTTTETTETISQMDLPANSQIDNATDGLEMLGILDSDAPLETTASNDSRPAKHVFHFGFNKAELSDEEKTIIQDHGQFLASHPSQSIVVHGHADSQGDQNYNQFLSDKRAQHVATLLKKAGANKDQIEVFSWSSASPADVVTNYKVNRRVELHYGQDYFAQKTQ